MPDAAFAQCKTDYGTNQLSELAFLSEKKLVAQKLSHIDFLDFCRPPSDQSLNDGASNSGLSGRGCRDLQNAQSPASICPPVDLKWMFFVLGSLGSFRQTPTL